jgi:uncharacterized protein (TIGR02270 family)
MTRIARPDTILMEDVLDEHLEDLEFLLQQRESALYSPEYTRSELRELERRIAAHVDGLLIGLERTVALATARLADEEPGMVFAVAHTLLRLEVDSATRVVGEAFLAAQGRILSALVAALKLGPITLLADFLARTLRSAKAPTAVAAAEALAFHSKLDVHDRRLAELMEDNDPEVRVKAWKTVSLLDLAPVPGLARPYASALADTDARVRDAALTAGAWTQQKWVLAHCRMLAAKVPRESFSAVWLLAILGTAQDLDTLLPIAHATELGSRRFSALASFGHPGVGDALVAGLSLADPRAAAGASAAFTRMTGIDVRSAKRVGVLPEDETWDPTAIAPDILPDLVDEVALPDVEKATHYWTDNKARYQLGLRWAQGRNLSSPDARSIAEGLDLKTRFEAHLRSRYEGHWLGSPSELERLLAP